MRLSTRNHVVVEWSVLLLHISAGVPSIVTDLLRNNYSGGAWQAKISPIRRWYMIFLSFFVKVPFKCFNCDLGHFHFVFRLLFGTFSFFFLWRYGPTRAMASSFMRFLDHTQWRTTVGRTPLDEWSARRRDLYLTTHNTHNRHPCPRWDSSL